jgi:hypothetical protein
MSLNEKLSFFSLYFASSEYSFAKLTNFLPYPDVLIDWTACDDDEANDWDEIDEVYSWDRNRDETNDEDGTNDRDETNDEYSIDRL